MYADEVEYYKKQNKALYEAKALEIKAKNNKK